MKVFSLFLSILLEYFTINMSGKRVSQDLNDVTKKMKSEGLSVTQISKNIDKPKSTISLILKKSRPLAMIGRPRKTNESTDRKMILTIKRNRFSSYSVISSSFNVSRETLHRRANEFGFKSRVAVINPLTKCNKLKRKLWCKSHLNENFSNYIAFN